MARWSLLLALFCSSGFMGCGRPQFRPLPPEAPAPAQVCADCGGRVVKFQYGLLDLDGRRAKIEEIVAGGKRHSLVRLDTEEFLEGGCVAYPASPGWACVACGRVWSLFQRTRYDRSERRSIWVA